MMATDCETVLVPIGLLKPVYVPGLVSGVFLGVRGIHGKSSLNFLIPSW